MHDIHLRHIEVYKIRCIYIYKLTILCIIICLSITCIHRTNRSIQIYHSHIYAYIYTHTYLRPGQEQQCLQYILGELLYELQGDAPEPEEKGEERDKGQNYDRWSVGT